MRLACAALLLIGPAVLAEDKKDDKAPKAREITATGLKVQGTVKGGLDKPAKATTKADLEKLLDKDSAEAVGKKVDFKKEYVLIFAWAGSGQDKLAMKVETTKKGDEAVFSYTRGRTRDLRRHLKVYAIPTKTTYKVGK